MLFQKNNYVMVHSTFMVAIFLRNCVVQDHYRLYVFLFVRNFMLLS